MGRGHARTARGLRSRPGSRARRVGRGGRALLDSDDLALGAERGTRGRRGPGRPAVEGDEPRADRERGKKSAREPSPGSCPRWRTARWGALPGSPRAPGQAGRVCGGGGGGVDFPLWPTLHLLAWAREEVPASWGLAPGYRTGSPFSLSARSTVAPPKFRGMNRTRRRPAEGHGDPPLRPVTPHRPARRCSLQRTSVAEGGPHARRSREVSEFPAVPVGAGTATSQLPLPARRWPAGPWEY